MKIKKFNEKYYDSNLPDYLKNTIVEEYLEKNLELVYLKDKIKILVIEWYKLNKEYINEKYNLNRQILPNVTKEIKDFDMFGDDYTIFLKLNWTNIYLDIKDNKDLITYIENPDLYKDTKNFNL